MGYRRTLAMLAMKGKSSSNDFMSQANLPLPEPQVAGALPVMVRGLNTATQLHMLMDLIVLWGIGDFESTYECSSYYDPSSPWYNVFFGAYAIRSYKRDGTAWGYTAKGQANFDEFLQVAGLDYNFLTAAQFGCPPSKMCFAVDSVATDSKNGWDLADVIAQIPSGLHDPTKYPADLSTYIAFGIPDPSFLNGRGSYEPVQVHGQFYMRRLSVPSGSPPITLAWGTACPKTSAGNSLLEAIIQTLGQAYLPLGS